ncbi:MAG TPA: ATP-binding protein [Jiangellales bacterium]|nr:ATP-binding protein [Jiangellales bacterium]
MSPRRSPLPAPERLPDPSSGRWIGAVRSARFRILVSYVVLLAFSAVLSVVAIREVLLIRLDARIEAAMDQELLELNRMLDVGRNPETGEAFTSLTELFEVYFTRNVPSSEEGMLSYVDGRLDQVAMDRYPIISLPAEVRSGWADFAAVHDDGRASETGHFVTELGQASYRIDSVRLGDDVGAFVVTVLPAAELRELDGLMTYGLAAALGVLVLATACAWPIAGRVLAPVRQLTDTARSISESDLTRRIQVAGRGEAAEMAASFNAMLDRLEAVFSSQRSFVREASHELRDPLTIIRGHLEVVGDDPTERRETLRVVLDEVERMGRTVADLQVLADVDQPDFLRPALIDLRSFTRELLTKVSMLGDRHWVLDGEAHGFVVADRHRLTEAVTNLAHNAVQHTAAGGTIGIGTAMSRDEWMLWVRDTGSGVAEADRVRIFERFTRGAGAARRYQGSGLGLSIVKAVAEAHGGRVELHSRVGEGATFTLVVPAGAEGDAR